MVVLRLLIFSLVLAGASALQSPDSGPFFLGLANIGREAFSGLAVPHGSGEGRCAVEYDDVWEEKCETVFEDKCTVDYK